MSDILNQVKTDDVIEWCNFMINGDRIIQRTHIRNKDVSTVFMGVDNRLSQKGNPILFETMVFGNDSDNTWNHFCKRYETLEDAKLWHERICKAIGSFDKPEDIV